MPVSIFMEVFAVVTAALKTFVTLSIIITIALLSTTTVGCCAEGPVGGSSFSCLCSSLSWLFWFIFFTWAALHADKTYEHKKKDDLHRDKSRSCFTFEGRLSFYAGRLCM